MLLHSAVKRLKPWINSIIDNPPLCTSYRPVADLQDIDATEIL
jgi:hypothetical protein